jgi:hypothetical protein
MESCIRYRTVVNDAVCHPWQDMPEVQPPTYQGLVKYLKEVCGIDPRPLRATGTFEGNGHYLSYGERKQFYLPGLLASADIEEMERWHAVPENVRCPICGEALEFFEDYTMGYHPETYYAAFCKSCDLRMTKNSKMARLAIDLDVAIKKAASRKLSLGV